MSAREGAGPRERTELAERAELREGAGEREGTEPREALPPGWRPRPFRAPVWAFGAHAQTLAGKALRPSPALPLERVRWETPDGDLLLVDLLDAEREGAPLVVVLHGLEGNSRRAYALLTYAALRRRGMAAAGLNFRSCGGEPNRHPRFYHSGETGDLAFVLDRLRERWPDRPMAAVGFSLGGNVLLKLLGEEGDAARRWLLAAAVVSVPFDLDAGGRQLESTLMGRLYTRYFLRSLQAKAEGKADLLEEVVALESIRAARTLRAFDEAATAPLHGFEDAAHYYAESSSLGFLQAVRVPTLVVHSLDDPFLPREAVPRKALEANPWLVPLLTRRGGHVGFVRGWPWAPRFWAEEEVARFLEAALLPG